MTIRGRVGLGAGENRFSLRVPHDAEPGDYRLVRKLFTSTGAEAFDVEPGTDFAASGVTLYGDQIDFVIRPIE